MSGKQFPISLILKAVDKATAPIRQVSASIGDISKQVSSAGKTLTAGVTLPLAGLAVASVAAFGRFEAGMANVSTLVDTSKESMAQMEKGVIAVTRAVKVQPLGEMAAALGTIRGAGISAADQFKVLEGSAKLAAAALGTTEEASGVATSAIKSWNMEGKDAENVYNQLFQAVNFGKMNLSQFAQGFGDVASVAAGAGIKFDEYASSVAALTVSGTQASTAHTQLRAVISGLTNQSKEASAIFHRLGVKDLKTLIDQSGGLVPALEKVKGVVKGNDTVLLKALGGMEAFSAVIALTGNLAETQKQALGTMRSGVDGLTGAWEKQARTGKATMQNLQNELEIIAISVGRVLVPVLQQLAPILERLADRWEAMGSEGQTAVVAVAAGVAALGPAITIMGNLATAVHAANVAFTFVGGWAKYLWMMRASIMAGLVPSLSAASASVWGFTAALLANPITWVVVALAAVGAAAYQVYKHWEPLKEFFSQIWNEPKAAIDLFVRWVDDVFGALSPLTYLYVHWDPIKAYFSNLWDNVVGVFQRAWEKIKPIMDVVGTAFSYTPLGVAVNAGRSLLGGGERPTLGAAQMAPGAGVLAPQQSETRVVVDFSNLPRGARVTEAPGGTAPLDLSLGYGMMGG